jgi:hypothetical protein
LVPDLDLVDDGVDGAVLCAEAAGDINKSPPPPLAKEKLLFELEAGVCFGGGDGIGVVAEVDTEDFGVAIALVSFRIF